MKILVHNLSLVNFETEGLETRSNLGKHFGGNFGNPNSTNHSECNMSRAAAEKKQRKVLEVAQKKRRADEAKAEKARQRAAAAAAAEVWSGTGHRHPCDLTAI